MYTKYEAIRVWHGLLTLVPVLLGPMDLDPVGGERMQSGRQHASVFRDPGTARLMPNESTASLVFSSVRWIRRKRWSYIRPHRA